MKIVLLGFGELTEGGWTNPQWMAKTLASKKYHVDYFSPPAYRMLKFQDLKRIFYRLFFFKKTSNKFFSHNVVYPFKFFGKFLNKNLHNLIESSDVIIIFQPNWLRCIEYKNIKHKKIIYFKTDDYYSIAKNKLLIKRLESLLIEASSSVCVTSKNLMLKNQNYFYFPNCIPKSILDSISLTERSKSKENISKACFIGAIWDEKVNIEMLINFIYDLKNIDFHFAGKILSKRFQDFIENSPENFKYHGVLPFEEAQNLAVESDFGLMPFLINKYTDSMFSMKFFEYIAAGIPVLTTNIKMLNEIDNFKKYIVISNNFSKHDLKKIHKIRIDSNEVKTKLNEYTYESRIDKMTHLNIL
jgi:glycosyltransferase involved in cell wall biosynthesis